VYDDIPEEILFGGGHKLHRGDRIKFVPLSESSCDANPKFDNLDYGGEVGPGIDGWGETVVTIRLYSFESPYALCTMESTKGEDSFSMHTHVVMHVQYAPSPPPRPPAAPPPFHIAQLLPHFGLPHIPHYSEWSIYFAEAIQVLETVTLALVACLVLYLVCACLCVCQHMDPFRFHRLEDPAPHLPPPVMDLDRAGVETPHKVGGDPALNA